MNNFTDQACTAVLDSIAISTAGCVGPIIPEFVA